MKGPLLGIVIVLALLATGAIFYASEAFRPAPTAPLEQLYANDFFGFSFSYPVGYILAESEVGTVSRKHHVVTIIKEEDAVPRVHSEGPTAITIDVYQNDTNPLSLETWIASSESNLRLGNGTLVETSVGGVPAKSFNWSGLYEGESIAFLHAGNIVVISVTYMSPSDDIYKAYQALLASLRLRN